MGWCGGSALHLHGNGGHGGAKCGDALRSTVISIRALPIRQRIVRWAIHPALAVLVLCALVATREGIGILSTARGQHRRYSRDDLRGTERHFAYVEYVSLLFFVFCVISAVDAHLCSRPSASGCFFPRRVIARHASLDILCFVLLFSHPDSSLLFFFSEFLPLWGVVASYLGTYAATLQSAPD